MSLRTLLPFLAALLLVGCRPGALDETGKLCSSTRLCGPGYVCLPQGTCAAVGSVPPGDGGSPDGGATSSPNLLQNPGFEQGNPGPTAWSATPSSATVMITNSPVHAGAQAALIYDSFGGTFGVTPSSLPVLAAAAGDIYCATAWVAGGGGPAQLVIQGGSGISGASGTATTSSGYAQLQAVYTAAPNETVTVIVQSPSPPPGFTLDVDDVALWRAPNTSCPPPAP